MSTPNTRPPQASQQPLKAYSRRAATVCLAAAAVAICWLVPAAFAVDPPEVVIGPAREGVVPLTAQEQKNVNAAIDRGVAYLRGMQQPTGLCDDGSRNTRLNTCSFASLPGLALLESAVRPGDPAVQTAARFVRNAAGTLTYTYDISLAILFLDRLGEGRDRPLVRSLALRLAAGQTSLGGWSYHCPLLSPAQEDALLTRLRAS
jgi:hypothetical protein